MSLGQVVSPRAVAASGTAEPTTPIWETHLAVGTTGSAGQDVLALFNTWFGYAFPHSTLGYAYWDGAQWSEDQIKVDDGNGNPNDDTTDGHQIDPVVVFDELAETYTCLAMNNQSGQKRLAVAHFDAADPSAVRWRDFWPTDHDPYALDKPWLVPGGFQDTVHTSPQLAADPTDPNRLYLVYHDTDPEAPSDVNVYLTSLVYSGGQWTALPRVKVNNDGNAATDQFLPSIVVDDFGVIHIIFYDDRQYVQGDSAPDAQYDVWYARSVDGGANFEDNSELWGLSGLPALDETTASTSLRKPGEYIGITYFSALDQIWTSYGGTSLFDPSNEQTVIWSSKIQQ